MLFLEHDTYPLYVIPFWAFQKQVESPTAGFGTDTDQRKIYQTISKIT